MSITRSPRWPHPRTESRKLDQACNPNTCEETIMRSTITHWLFVAAMATLALFAAPPSAVAQVGCTTVEPPCPDDPPSVTAPRYNAWVRVHEWDIGMKG
jgi:hypothetical protein